jgi:hypothetical protein
VTESEDLKRVNAELLAAFQKLGAPIRKLIRAEIGHDLEFVVIAWDLSRQGPEGQLPNAYHCFTLRTMAESLRVAELILKDANQLAPEPEAATPIRTLN